MTTSPSVEVPLCRPCIGDEEINAVIEVIKSGWMAHGPYNHKFEEAFAAYLGVKHAIVMNSCTSALEVALRVPRIRGEVITPSFTFVATANTCLTSGATPVFCEVDEATRNVTAATIAERITPRTEAVMVVHYGGQVCQMDEIVALCERKGLRLIEDSAETLGATWRGRQAGSFGTGCFSFFPTKNITTGEGGMLTCDDDSFAEEARALIAHGIKSSTFAREKVAQPWLRAAELPGHNYRLSNVLAAMGYHQLRKLDDMNRRRVAIAARFDAAFADLGAIVTPRVVDGATHVYQMYTVQVVDGDRNAIVHRLRAAGIGASVHFTPPAHLQPAYLERGSKRGDLPVTERLADTLITLPMFPDMSEDQQVAVIEQVRAAVG